MGTPAQAAGRGVSWTREPDAASFDDPPQGRAGLCQEAAARTRSGCEEDDPSPLLRVVGDRQRARVVEARDRRRWPGERCSGTPKGVSFKQHALRHAFGPNTTRPTTRVATGVAGVQRR